jgi:hypothetical protein
MAYSGESVEDAGYFYAPYLSLDGDDNIRVVGVPDDCLAWVVRDMVVMVADWMVGV